MLLQHPPMGCTPVLLHWKLQRRFLHFQISGTNASWASRCISQRRPGPESGCGRTHLDEDCSPYVRRNSISTRQRISSKFPLQICAVHRVCGKKKKKKTRGIPSVAESRVEGVREALISLLILLQGPPKRATWLGMAALRKGENTCFENGVWTVWSCAHCRVSPAFKPRFSRARFSSFCNASLAGLSSFSVLRGGLSLCFAYVKRHLRDGLLPFRLRVLAKTLSLAPNMFLSRSCP